MSNKAKGNNQYMYLKKVFAGLIVVCFLVFVVGQTIVGVSADSMVLWSSLLVLVVGVSAQIIIRLWRSWEEVQGGSMVSGPQDKDLR